MFPLSQLGSYSLGQRSTAYSPYNPRSASSSLGARRGSIGTDPMREVLISLNTSNNDGFPALQNLNHNHHNNDDQYTYSPFNSTSNSRSGGLRSSLSSNSTSSSNSSSLHSNNGERYIYPPDRSHIRIDVLYESNSRSSSLNNSLGSRSNERNFVAVIPEWASVDDIYENLCMERGKRFEIFIHTRGGGRIPLNQIRDITDLQRGAEALILVEV